MASSDYLSTIANSLSLSHPCRFMRVSLIRFLPDPKRPTSRCFFHYSATPTMPPTQSIMFPSQSTQEMSSILPSQGHQYITIHFGLSLLPILYGAVDCSMVIIYFTANIHSLVSTYHVCFSVSGIPYSGWFFILIPPVAFKIPDVIDFNSWVMLHCGNVPHFLCPLCGWGAPRLFPCSG